MSNFRVHFLYPWLLLLLVPAAVLAAIFYFRLSKKYRFTRNRVLSIVLFLTIMLLSVSILSGINFTYAVPNTTNEIILLVDASFSNKEAQLRKNAFIKTALDESDSSFKMGIVIFAKEQKYVAKLSHNTKEVYDQYLDALDDASFDDSATDISSAFKYIVDEKIFSNPKSGKIVLISDGIETDKNSISAVVGLSMQGIKIDTVYFSNNYDGDAQIIDITPPDYNILVGETVNIDVTIESSYVGAAFLTLYDNGVPSPMKDISLDAKTETFHYSYVFEEPGAHELCFVIKSGNDTIQQNNVYYSYIFLDSYDKVLIIDKGDESMMLESLLKENYAEHEKDKVKVIRIDDGELPNTVEQLRNYDEIILMNIANEDMPYGFSNLLETYVKTYGGGLLTVGGNKRDEIDMYGNPVANAYNRADMAGTVYQNLLPVDCVDYTPPLALMLLIDRSGSMEARDSQQSQSRMELAKEGARACIAALSERDYVGLISFNNGYTVDLPLTPVTQKATILDKISKLQADGGTVYTGPIDKAGQMLQAIPNVEKRHIMFVTDGEPSDKSEVFENLISNYYTKSGITLSTVAIVSGDISANSSTIKRMARIGHGQDPEVVQEKDYYYSVINVQELPDIMRKDIELPEIKAVVNKEFIPVINDYGVSVMGLSNQVDEDGNPILDKDGNPVPVIMPKLNGFYGSRLKKKTAENNLECTLIGEISAGSPPIYAQWKLGKGKVGSFMCDLNGISWSSDFFNNPSGYGKVFIHNVIRSLSPSESIRAQEIEVEFNHDNYQVQAKIKTLMDEGDTLKVTVKSPLNQIDLTKEKQVELEFKETVYWAELSVTSDKSIPLAKCAYDVYDSGIYQIKIERINAANQVVGNPYIKYQTFSYSQEYNSFVDTEKNIELLTSIAEKGKGALITAPTQMFTSYEMFDKLTYDPRVPFIIIAIILFLLNIAVIKFKFKWPWELVRDYKERKLLKNERDLS